MYYYIITCFKISKTFFFRKDEEEKEEGEVEEPHPLVSVTDINPEDIPEVPTNKFLLRGGDSKDEKRGGKIISS